MIMIPNITVNPPRTGWELRNGKSWFKITHQDHEIKTLVIKQMWRTKKNKTRTTIFSLFRCSPQSCKSDSLTMTLLLTPYGVTSAVIHPLFCSPHLFSHILGQLTHHRMVIGSGYIQQWDCQNLDLHLVTLGQSSVTHHELVMLRRFHFLVLILWIPFIT